jgi:hypothetical protein
MTATMRTVNSTTFFRRAELVRVRTTLLDDGLPQATVARLTRSRRTLSDETSLIFDELLERPGSDRDRVLEALERHLGLTFVDNRPSNAPATVIPGKRGRPRALRCCSHHSKAFGGSFADWPCGACLSDDGRYRYSLWRRSSVEQPTAVFILKNPSTANHIENDASAHNCRKSAAKVGLGCELVNLYPWRGDVDSLLTAGDARFGDRELNYDHIRQSIRRAKMVVLGFGDFDGPMRALRSDVADLRNLIERECRDGRQLHALRITKSGAPWHPARLSAAPVPIPYATWPEWL